MTDRIKKVETDITKLRKKIKKEKQFNKKVQMNMQIKKFEEQNKLL